MKKALLVVMSLQTLLLVTPLPAWAGDAAADMAQMTLRASSVPALQTAATKAGGYAPKSVSVVLAAHQITLLVTNSCLNGAPDTERETNAAHMVSAVVSAIQGKPEFSGISVIHVDCEVRTGQTIKVVDRIDFFETPAGFYVMHRT